MVRYGTTIAHAGRVVRPGLILLYSETSTRRVRTGAVRVVGRRDMTSTRYLTTRRIQTRYEGGP